MIKQALLTILLIACSAAIAAQSPDSCVGLTGDLLGQCRAKQQQLQQQQLEGLQRQIQEQQERQRQLDDQQRQIRDQLESMRLQNESLRQQIEREKSTNPPALPPPTDYSKTAEAKSWRSDNPWYGSNYAKTEFAIRYAKQLEHDRPDLVGRPFLDAISAKVNETFGASK